MAPVYRTSPTWRGSTSYPIPLVYVLMLFASLSSACDGVVLPEREVDARMLLPLEPGNSWIYHRNSSEADTLVRTISLRRDIDGRVFFVQERQYHTTRDGWAFGSSQIFSYGPEGLFAWTRLIDDVDLTRSVARSPSLFFPFQARGIIDYPYESSDGVRFTRIVSTDTLVTVPSGTFRCLAYATMTYSRIGSEVVVGLSYFSPGVGLVKYVSDDVEDVLVAYRVSD
jgi:hypothetical protein